MTTALVVLFIEYRAIQPLHAMGWRSRHFDPMARWAILSFLAYTVVPLLLTLLVFRMKPAEVGLSFRQFFRHLPLYVGMYFLMVPVIWFASKQPAFLNTYPFNQDARNGLTDLLKWEAVYGLQFLGLEFFFRGFVVFCLARRFGVNAVFVMVVPYCMIHFHKPGLEAIASIGAGVILGVLAYRTRSIFGGVLIHFAVAVTMDVLAILGTGGFR